LWVEKGSETLISSLIYAGGYGNQLLQFKQILFSPVGVDPCVDPSPAYKPRYHFRTVRSSIYIIKPKNGKKKNAEKALLKKLISARTKRKAREKTFIPVPVASSSSFSPSSPVNLLKSENKSMITSKTPSSFNVESGQPFFGIEVLQYNDPKRGNHKRVPTPEKKHIDNKHHPNEKSCFQPYVV